MNKRKQAEEDFKYLIRRVDITMLAHILPFKILRKVNVLLRMHKVKNSGMCYECEIEAIRDDYNVSASYISRAKDMLV